MRVVWMDPLEDRRLFAVAGVNLGTYHSVDALKSALQSLAGAFPTLTQLSSIGKSEQNRDIWAIKISDHPGRQEDEPEFKYIGAMHGDEPVGQEMTLHFAAHLLENYGVDPRITRLVDETEIWIVPNMNPDGLHLDWRKNSDFVDLNRDFPDGATSHIGTIFDGPAMDTAGRAKETATIMRWSAGNSFTLSANLHAGAMVVNYPYDSNNNDIPDNAPTPDDALFRELALTYSRTNLPMYTNPEFAQGISNGDAWYEIEGGMQDWNYRYLGGNEVTIELNNQKKPPAEELERLWDDNRESMTAYLEAVHWGIRGNVTRSTDGDPVYAKVSVAGNSHPIFTDPDVGDYHRMLLPGSYNLTFSAPGYQTRTIKNLTVTATTSDPSQTLLRNVKLTPTDQSPPALAAGEFAFDANPAQLRARFNEAVKADLTGLNVLIKDGVGSTFQRTITGNYDEATKTVRLHLGGQPLPDGNYQASWKSPKLRDRWGNPFAGDVNINFFTLGADANRDRKVDQSDFTPLSKNFGKTSAVFSQGDFNYSGRIDSRDFNLLLKQYGKTLDPLPAVAARALFALATQRSEPALADI